MNRKRKWEKEERREAITDVIRQNPCLTDEDLAKRFSVSAATIRLDRQMLGIPQMRKRIEKAVSEHPSGFHEELQILDMEKGKKGLALFHTTGEMTDRSGMVSADRLYAAAADFAQSLAGQVFTPVQVGNIKYKEPVGSGEQLVLKGKIALMKVNRKYIYISFFKRAAEVFRAKFIMEVSKTGGEALHG